MPTTAPARSPGARLVHRFRTDMGHYAPRVLRIQTKDGQLTPLSPNRAQMIVEEKVEAQLASLGYVRALILKARQEGISTWIGARVFRGCTLWKNRNALVLGDTDERAGILYRIYDRFYDETPDPEFRPPKKASRRGQELLFGHDSQISVATAGGKNPGRGITRWYLHLSELAFWTHQLDTLIAVLQAVPQGRGEVYIESTANGVGDEFHTRWELAVAGESDWLAIFLPWWIHEEYTLGLGADELELITATTDRWERHALDVGIEWEGEAYKLTPAQLAWRRWKIANDFGGDPRPFRQEFPSTAEEAFLVSGNAYFDEEALMDYRRKVRKPRWRGNMLRDAKGGFIFRAAERGYLRVWEKPKAGRHYVIAADTASGKLSAARDSGAAESEAERGGRDFSSADVIDVEARRQVAQLHGRMAPEVFGEQLWLLGHWFSCAPEGKRARTPALIGVERNHDSGQTTIRYLREHNYRRLFVHRRLNRRTDELTEEVGWITDGTTRMPMLDEFAAGLRNGTVEVLSADTLRECTTFVRNDEGRPEAQENCHDDRVISYAIGLQMVRHHTHGAMGQTAPPEVADTPTGM